jgi:hypothetical protein
MSVYGDLGVSADSGPQPQATHRKHLSPQLVSTAMAPITPWASARQPARRLRERSQLTDRARLTMALVRDSVRSPGSRQRRVRTRALGLNDPSCRSERFRGSARSCLPKDARVPACTRFAANECVRAALTASAHSSRMQDHFRHDLCGYASGRVPQYVGHLSQPLLLRRVSLMLGCGVEALNEPGNQVLRGRPLAHGAPSALGCCCDVDRVSQFLGRPSGLDKRWRCLRQCA